jgi:hypothetical protein
MLKFTKKEATKEEVLSLSECIKVLKSKKVSQNDIDTLVSILRYFKANLDLMSKLLRNPVIVLYTNFVRPLDIIKFCVLKEIKLSSLTIDTYASFYETLMLKSMKIDLNENTKDFIVKSEDEEIK